MNKIDLLTVKEVAQKLRVDPTTVRRWIKNGSLEAVSFPYMVEGRQRQTHRIYRSTLDALLQKDGDLAVRLQNRE